MKHMFVLALLGLALAGCLVTGDMMKNISVSTMPSPLILDSEKPQPLGVITLTNNNTFEISVQCFPPEGPGEGYTQERESGIVNETLFTRPEVRCYDSEALGNLSRAVFPSVTIRPRESHAFVVEAMRFGSVQTISNETFVTAPGDYGLELRLDVRCHEPGCGAEPKGITLPIQIRVPGAEG